MNPSSRNRRAFVLAASLALAGEAQAQTLDLSTVVFASGATADWVTTYRNRDYFREGNPLIAWLDAKPVAMIGVGVALDAASVYGWTRLTRKHTRLRAIGFYTAAAVRFGVAYRNDRMRRAADRP